MSENLSEALMIVCVVLEEKDIEPLLKYLRRGQTAEEADAEKQAKDAEQG